MRPGKMTSTLAAVTSMVLLVPMSAQSQQGPRVNSAAGAGQFGTRGNRDADQPSLQQRVQAAMRANPGKANYSSGGNGSAAHLSAELFKQGFHVSVVHIPYKGGAPALVDVVCQGR